LELGCDSLDEVKIVMAVEDFFDVSIPDEDWTSTETCAVFAEYLHKNYSVLRRGEGP